MHDPFAMRPFVGYNIGQYFDHWLSFGEKKNVQLPRIFHVNWFRKDAAGKFMWPGFGENARVLDWILKRVEGEDAAVTSPVGFIPKKESFNLKGLPEIDWNGLFSTPKPFWEKEASAIKSYFDDNIGSDLPKKLSEEVDKLEKRIRKDNE